MNLILVIVITVIFSAFFSGMETAFVTANKLKIELDKKRGLISGKILASFIESPSKFVSTMVLGNNISLVIYGMAISLIIEPFLKSYLPASINYIYFRLVINTVISTLFILFFAEFIPKNLFRMRPNQILNFFSIPLKLIYYILYPLLIIFVKSSELIIKILFRKAPKTEKYVFSHVDLDHYFQEFTPDPESVEDQAAELQLFQNAIEFRSVKIRECMIPRNEILALDESDSIDALKENFINSGHSKIIIYKGNIDNIIGYVHSYDLFQNPADIKSIIKPVIIAPEAMFAKEMLKTFILQRKSIAVVVDEFGGTSGMLTIEDVIEEITGEINDEYDSDTLTEKKINNDEYIFSGRIEIDYINEKYKLNLPKSEMYETLAGLIINYHESIPVKNEQIAIDNLVFTIIQASKTKIELVNLKISQS